MSTWKELEAEFRDMQEALRFSRLDAQWGTSGEYWRLARSHDTNAKRRFEALARIAGKKLGKTLECSAESYQEVLLSQIPRDGGTRECGKLAITSSMPSPRKNLMRTTK